MSVPRGFKPFYRQSTATKLGVKINEKTGHLLFNTLAKRELVDMLNREQTKEVGFYFDEDTKRIYMAPVRQGERGWRLNTKNGMISAAKVRDWMMDHDYEPSVQYSLIAHERGFVIEPETTLPITQPATATTHTHVRRSPADTRIELQTAA